MYIKEKLKPKIVFQDSEGRMLAVEIFDQNKKKLLVRIYVPNGAKEKFFLNLKQKLNAETYNQIIIMGDFNGVTEPLLDKTSHKKGEKLPKIFFEMAQQENLVDSWRVLNTQVKDYTYFSSSKKSWTRIDMVWATTSLIPLIKKVDILPKILSDHNLIICILRRREEYKWRLNEDLL